MAGKNLINRFGYLLKRLSKHLMITNDLGYMGLVKLAKNCELRSDLFVLVDQICMMRRRHQQRSRWCQITTETVNAPSEFIGECLRFTSQLWETPVSGKPHDHICVLKAQPATRPIEGLWKVVVPFSPVRHS
jgi:hypothetical protein